MSTAPTYADAAQGRRAAQTTSVGVIAALSASHMLNDTMQSLAPALYPMFARELSLSFFQIGLITFVFQLTASLLQPLIGFALDRRPLSAILRSAWPSPWSGSCCSPSRAPIRSFSCRSR